MGNGINKILPDLYLGNMRDARDPELLAQHNITHILSVHDTAAPVLEGVTYLCISASDHSKQNLTQYFRDSIVFIHESRLKGEGCLVHCVAGVSRSVTLVVAYIMTVTDCGWVEALAAVRSARPCAGPNLGFLRQLEEFENTQLAELPHLCLQTSDAVSRTFFFWPKRAREPERVVSGLVEGEVRPEVFQG
uniref:Dual specificity phosphatase 22a n=1 Tax=Oryzias latipes TaxID=8090 RepID=A0A3B3HPC6_ORYLA